ncbi:MAG: tyrosine-type recombinase/integrase [Treponema sp.]|nr:tyrosine-type recombinase/integrase [Treponema sp.]
MTVKDSCEEFLLYLATVKGMTENTVQSYGEDYKKLNEFLGPDTEIDKVSVQDLRFCVGSLSAQKFSVATINRFIASLRALFAYSQKFGRLKVNPALEIKTLKAPKHLPNFMTGTEVDALCDAPQKNELLWASRDKAIFEMLYSSGCRVAELASLKLGDFSAGGKSAVVKGKGKKDRIVYFEDDALAALKDSLVERKALLLRLKLPGQKALFVNKKGGQLSTRGIRWIVSRYSGPEGTNRHVSPHAFRHTFANSMLSSGADVRVVQEMLGHSSISTTQRYTHVTTQQLIDTYRQAHPHG